MLQASTLLMALGFVVWSLTWTEVLKVPIEVFWVFSLGGICVLLMHIAAESRTSKTYEQQRAVL